jgi:prefoldin subunit 5
MNIDQRLEKLVERHEALTQSVEMLASDLRELKTLVSDIAEGTARLLHVVEVHERRISDLEAGNQTQQ